MSGMDQRINVNLPHDIHMALRVYCIQQRRTMGEVIIEALTRLLASRPAAASEAKPST